MSTPSDAKTMRGKVCVVTGATSGLGRETVLALARKDAEVVLIGRSQERGEAILAQLSAENVGAGSTFLAADFSSLSSIRRLGAMVRARYPRVDVLVNNAGVLNSARRLTVDGLEETFAVNHLAPFLLTHLLGDQLLASPAARVVTVSSDAHRWPRDLAFDNLQGERRFKSLNAYGVSKLANVLFTYELARRFEGSTVRANCLHPGVVRTGLWQDTRGLVRLACALAWPFMLSSVRASDALVHLASAPELERVNGRYFHRSREVHSSELSYNFGHAKQLWDVSQILAIKS